MCWCSSLVQSALTRRSLLTRDRSDSDDVTTVPSDHAWHESAYRLGVCVCVKGNNLKILKHSEWCKNKNPLKRVEWEKVSTQEKRQGMFACKDLRVHKPVTE